MTTLTTPTPATDLFSSVYVNTHRCAYNLASFLAIWSQEGLSPCDRDDMNFYLRNAQMYMADSLGTLWEAGYEDPESFSLICNGQTIQITGQVVKDATACEAEYQLRSLSAVFVNREVEEVMGELSTAHVDALCDYVEKHIQDCVNEHAEKGLAHF